MKTFNRNAQLNLESLDDRLVPSATQLSLASRDAVVTQPGFVAFQGHTQAPKHSQLENFLSVDAPRNQAEQGYNTNARPLQFNESRDRDLTQALTLGQVPVVTVGGVNYREFVLDVNEGGSPKLSVDAVRIFLGNKGNLRATAAEAASGVMTFNGTSPVFDLDANGDVALMLNARVKAGNGFGDMTLLVPDAAFTGASIKDNVYFYTRMGDQAGEAANGGYENWAVRQPRTPVAPPSGDSGTKGGTGTLSISGSVTNDVGGSGIANVVINLTGVDINGKSVNLSTSTLADGSFQFSSLVAGTYSISEVQPAGYNDGQDYIGNDDNGEFPNVDASVNDVFSNIVLVDMNGTNFLYTDLQQAGS